MNTKNVNQNDCLITKQEKTQNVNNKVPYGIDPDDFYTFNSLSSPFEKHYFFFERKLKNSSNDMFKNRSDVNLLLWYLQSILKIIEEKVLRYKKVLIDECNIELKTLTKNTQAYKMHDLNRNNKWIIKNEHDEIIDINFLKLQDKHSKNSYLNKDQCLYRTINEFMEFYRNIEKEIFEQYYWDILYTFFSQHYKGMLLKIATNTTKQITTARNEYFSGLTIADVYNEAYNWLYKALISYDFDKQNAFSTHLFNWLKDNLKIYIKEELDFIHIPSQHKHTIQYKTYSYEYLTENNIIKKI